MHLSVSGKDATSVPAGEEAEPSRLQGEPGVHSSYQLEPFCDIIVGTGALL